MEPLICFTADEPPKNCSPSFLNRADATDLKSPAFCTFEGIELAGYAGKLTKELVDTRAPLSSSTFRASGSLVLEACLWQPCSKER
jgi:hypothetical protein